jgi:hypothetical protein
MKSLTATVQIGVQNQVQQKSFDIAVAVFIGRSGVGAPRSRIRSEA